MAQILLIDDDAALLDVLSLAFADAGHTVETAADGKAGLERALASSPNAIVSDINMPHVDGLALCRRLREKGNLVPLILLTSRDNEIDEALGLELGADDYVAKPFSTRVLLARVAALLRRNALRGSPSVPNAAIVTIGDLVLDPERVEGRYCGQVLSLTLTEFRLLEAIARRPGIVFSRKRLLEIVRGDESVVVERIVDTYVTRLRRKCEAIDPMFDRIETIVGAGYRWRQS